MNLRRFLAAIVAVLAMSSIARAQSNGDFYTYPVFDSSVTSIVNADGYLYFVSGPTLYRYDKAQNQLEVLDERNGMNGSIVNALYHNEDQGWMMVCYDDHNIDIIDTDGQVTNLPFFNEVQIVSSHQITDITFSGHRAFIATAYGFAVYDHQSGKMLESNIWYQPIDGIALVGDKLWIGCNYRLYYCDYAARHSHLSDFTASALNSWGKIKAIDDNSFFKYNSNYSASRRLVKVTVKDPATMDVDTITSIGISATMTMMPQRDADGTYLIRQNFNATSLASTIYWFNPSTNRNGSIAPTTGTLASLGVSAISAADSNGERWCVGTRGISRCTLDGNHKLTAEEPLTSINGTSMTYVGNFAYNEADDKLYVATVGSNLNKSLKGLSQNRGSINVIENGVASNVNTNLSVTVPITDTTSSTTPAYPRNIYSMTLDPNDPDIIYYGAWFYGIYKMRVSTGELLANYNHTNSTLELYNNYSCCVKVCQFDNDGNLWAVGFGSDANGHYNMLSSEHVQSDETTAEDWVTYDQIIPSFSPTIEGILAKKHNVLVVSGQWGGQSLHLFDCNSALNGQPRTRNWNAAIPTEKGYAFQWDLIYTMAEDANGNVWVGTNKGPFCMDMSSVFDDDFSVAVPTVVSGPENVGNALLTGMTVTAITYDRQGCLWFGTLANGLYHVSADGTQILAHYNTSNSMLPDNEVTALCALPGKDVVYVGTYSGGLTQINYTSHQSRNSYAQAKIFPSMVRPGFDGVVTVTDVVADATLTVADASGRTVAQITATGGKAQWNLLDADGQRVTTGQYTISANNGDQKVVIGTVKVMK